MNYRILHIAECYEAGVGHAVDTMVRERRDDTHLLLYSGDLTPSDRFETAIPFEAGFASRIKQVSDVSRRFRPDLIHLHSSWAGVYGRLARVNVPVVYQPHCFKFDDPSLPSLKAKAVRYAEKWLSPRSQVFLTLTEHEASLAKGLNAKARCVRLPNTPTVPVSTKLSLDESAPSEKVTMIGRICPQKDPNFFIEAAALVRLSHPNTEFVWAGDGDGDLKKRLIAAGVRVTGWLSSEELISLLDDTTCYLHSAAYEGFPLSVLDAAARDRPIVVRDIPPFHATGLLRGDDVKTVSAQIMDLLESTESLQDAKQRSRKLLEQMNNAQQSLALEKAYGLATGRIV